MLEDELMSCFSLNEILQVWTCDFDQRLPTFRDGLVQKTKSSKKIERQNWFSGNRLIDYLAYNVFWYM